MSTTTRKTHPHFCDHAHHNHHHNVYSHDAATRLQEAKLLCGKRGVRFTPLREDVYSLILEADKPVGAYDLISALQDKRRQNGDHKNIAPPTVYRSLGFLLEEGLIHQLSAINAYIPCCHPRAAHTAAFLICKNCHSVEECSNLPVEGVLDFAANDAKFAVQESVIELLGLCRQCQAANTQTP
ncbi:Fur family transcriptional regulator [Moraxella caviae]|uniref:Fur family transcriptional regulator n=1 Tax=Moraxella caviae TaxID=34060 RepID=A0A1T0A0R0_9GAMM|nr:transcriptional repressor [Moraxella caviae]OOR89257.1 Fur family transcriptional regulator [Moraxella caviae]STZ13866.1 Zinc uptake regulation protein [Moraxella caviae]VEW11176.1 Zinc uptake regulation protein [Moraxella caviae]